MSRAPTFTRFNIDELAGRDPALTRAQQNAIGAKILIEDMRKGIGVPLGWADVADKIVLAGRTIKDNTAPIDPTHRCGL